ncbi:G-D-S-L family lipolytic protein [Paenibacillus donghaensis]|uniref:SGNH/GDSL hydrolase family protein n=1 Tax=Paenibacillus donghaensis TaxID=414771 RepID=UPI0018831D31|nr:GDSL-type esterase/lipase family protein [Paenibacillus donghaensis]MBE9913812.1 G-D-S-L family lipolytic protein [Paenibacillus donghaensis]
MSRVDMIKPGLFSPLQAAADQRRMEYDCKNECLIAEKTPVDYLFIGDSIINLWELGAFFSSAKGAIINRGAGGDTCMFLNKRLEADALQLKPNHIVMLIGVNDLFKMDPAYVQKRDLWAPEEIEEHVVQNIGEMAERCKQRGQSLVLCSILPTNRTQSEVNGIRNECIVRINAKLRETAETYGCMYADFHRHMTAGDGLTLRDGLSDDELHPHAEGYRLMASELRETLRVHGYTI